MNLLNALFKTQPLSPSTDLATREELDTLHGKLENLITHHRAALEEESALEDVELLQHWIEGCLGGSKQAERKLYQEGLTLLENVKGKLTLALEEEHRMMEESPTAAQTSKGRHAERLAQANSTAQDALHTLTQISTDGTDLSNKKAAS